MVNISCPPAVAGDSIEYVLYTLLRKMEIAESMVLIEKEGNTINSIALPDGSADIRKII